MLVSSYYDKEPSIISNDENAINVKYITGELKNRKFCAGYCSLNTHPGYLTKKMVGKHKCHEKECIFFYESIAINKDKAEKKVKTDNIKVSLKKQQLDEKKYTELCEFVCKNFEGVKIINIYKDSDQKWLLQYVSIFNIDEELLKLKIEQLLQSKFVLKKIECDFDTAVKLVWQE